MSYPFNYPTPTNADVQIFYGSAATGRQLLSWTKPAGCSFVWFTLIGSGGNGGVGDNTSPAGGGGSGAVTNCLMPAFLVPDQLSVRAANPAVSAGPTAIVYTATGGQYILLQANQGSAGTVGGGGGAGGVATASTFFSCAGLYQSVAGQAGTVSASITPSGTTFLSGGAGSSINASITGNYGYLADNPPNTPINGYFQLQPIIVGLGASNNGGTDVAGRAGIGCGGSGEHLSGFTVFGRGGQGMAVIISW